MYLDNVNSHVDVTIKNICEYIDKLTKAELIGESGLLIAENTNALAVLITARALGEKFTN